MICFWKRKIVSLLNDLFLEKKNCFVLYNLFLKGKAFSFLYDLSLERKNCLVAV